MFIYLCRMKYNLLSLFFILFIGTFNYAQETLPQAESNKLYLKRGGVVVTNGIIFSSGRNVFFYVNEKDICKIQLSEVKNSDRFKALTINTKKNLNFLLSWPSEAITALKSSRFSKLASIMTRPLNSMTH